MCIKALKDHKTVNIIMLERIQVLKSMYSGQSNAVTISLSFLFVFE